MDLRDEIRVVTSNNFLKASGLENISVKAVKLLYLALAQCKLNDKDFFTYTIKAKDFAEFMGIDPSNIYQEADKITDELMQGFIKYVPINKKTFVKHQLFSICKYTESAEITFRMSEEMTPIVLGLKKDFTQPLLKDFARMRSGYSVSIWHIMQREMQSKKPGILDEIEFELSLEELRKITGTEKQKTYDKISNFKNKILDKAIREIRDNCAVDITYTNIKSGRYIVGFHFIAKSLYHIDRTSIRAETLAKAEAFEQKKIREMTAKEKEEYDRLTAHAEQLSLDDYLR